MEVHRLLNEQSGGGKEIKRFFSNLTRFDFEPCGMGCVQQVLGDVADLVAAGGEVVVVMVIMMSTWMEVGGWRLGHLIVSSLHWYSVDPVERSFPLSKSSFGVNNGSMVPEIPVTNLHLRLRSKPRARR